MRQHGAMRLCCIFVFLFSIHFNVAQETMLFADVSGGAVVENVLEPPSDVEAIKPAAEILKHFNLALSASENPDDEQIIIAVAAQLNSMILTAIINEAPEDLFEGYLDSYAAKNLDENLLSDCFSSLKTFGLAVRENGFGDAIKVLAKAGKAELLRLSGRLPGAFYFNSASRHQTDEVDHKAFLWRTDRLAKLLDKAGQNQHNAVLMKKSIEFVFRSAVYSRQNLLYPVTFFLPIALVQISEHSYFELLPTDAGNKHPYLLELAALQSITGKLLDNTDFDLDAHADSIREQHAALREYQSKLPLALNISRGLLEDKNAYVSARVASDVDLMARFLRSFSEKNVRQVVRSKFRDGHTWGEFSYDELFDIPEFKEGFARFVITGPLALSAYNASLGQASTISRFNAQLLTALSIAVNKVESEGRSAENFEELSDTVKAWYLMTVDEIKDSIKVLNARNESFTHLIEPESEDFCSGVFRNYRTDTARIKRDLLELVNIHSNFDYLNINLDPDSALAKALFLTE